MAKKHFVCTPAQLPQGERKLITIGSRQIGLFNVDGDYYALLNVCPHTGGNLCEGPVCGTNLPMDGGKQEYAYGMKDKVLRCAWHGWEFDIATGKNIADPHIRAKTYAVEVDNDGVFVIV